MTARTVFKRSSRIFRSPTKFRVQRRRRLLRRTLLLTAPAIGVVRLSPLPLTDRVTDPVVHVSKSRLSSPSVLCRSPSSRSRWRAIDTLRASRADSVVTIETDKAWAEQLTGTFEKRRSHLHGYNHRPRSVLVAAATARLERIIRSLDTLS